MARDRTKSETQKGNKKSTSGSYLSEEDDLLWRRVTESTTPLRGRELRRDSDISENGPEVPHGGADNARDGARVVQTPPLYSAPKEKQTPPLAEFDRKNLRQLGSERLEIDAELDLHGYRKDQAQAALKTFLMRAQAQKFRFVLVITGKDRVKGSQDVAFFDHYDTGVLKRLVPHWLEDLEFRELVVSYTSAHARHGGDGAVYVQVRRYRGSSGR